MWTALPTTVLETELEAMCTDGTNMEGTVWVVVRGNAGDGSTNHFPYPPPSIASFGTRVAASAKQQLVPVCRRRLIVRRLPQISGANVCGKPNPETALSNELREVRVKTSPVVRPRG